eukprot:TRINITY_DN2349_c1_g2_i1.p1 TRINITY_DN2349_c1_g2~~TRINITY_DN2349_c1_g2_i1.p1  ORF type:complete len:226 (-),score=25.39 TRINITY_DN2349_c1_g2_i1:116-793(-)
MFRCRECTENPCLLLNVFGAPPPEPEPPRRARRRLPEVPLPLPLPLQAPTSTPHAHTHTHTHTRRHTPTRKHHQDGAAFEQRNAWEVREVMEQWGPYIHPRTKYLWPSIGPLEKLLSQLALAIDASADPICGPDNECVQWYWHVSQEDSQPVIPMEDADKGGERRVRVIEILAFIFATDHISKQIAELPAKQPLKMKCGNQLCVNLAHISLDGSSCEGRAQQPEH